MNDNTKIEVAREVMNAMIGKYGRNGYDQSNTMLMTLLKDEEEMNKFNFAVIDKILNVIDSKYELVHIISKRSKQMANNRLRDRGGCTIPCHVLAKYGYL